MDLELNDDQRAIIEAVAGLLAQHAGADRAIELNSKREYDADLDAALLEAGFTEIALADGTDFVDAALVVEAVANSGGVVAVGAEVLVAPALVGRSLPGPVALTRADHRGPVRFASHARSLIIDDGDCARIVSLEAGEAEGVDSNFMYPMGRLQVDAGRGERLGPGSGEILRNWWRLSVAAEAVGTMAAALDVTLDYVKRRRQFGRAIGSFQAVQHRLAHCAVMLEGSRWLMYEAAYRGAPVEAAATAAAHATTAANLVFAETHQLSGAMGFTREHPLHVWSMRLQALRLELDGIGGHRRAAARARWLTAP